MTLTHHYTVRPQELAYCGGDARSKSPYRWLRSNPIFDRRLTDNSNSVSRRAHACSILYSRLSYTLFKLIALLANHTESVVETSLLSNGRKVADKYMSAANQCSHGCWTCYFCTIALHTSDILAKTLSSSFFFFRFTWQHVIL